MQWNLVTSILRKTKKISLFIFYCNILQYIFDYCNCNYCKISEIVFYIYFKNAILLQYFIARVWYFSVKFKNKCRVILIRGFLLTFLTYYIKFSLRKAFKFFPNNVWISKSSLLSNSLSVLVFLAVLNNLSEGQLVMGTARYFLANLDNRGNWSSYNFQNSKVFIFASSIN